MTDSHPAIDLGPKVTPDLGDTEKLGFRTPTLPSECPTIPKDPQVHLEDLRPDKPSPAVDEEPKVLVKPTVDLRRSKEAPTRRLPQKTYADLFEGRFIVNFSMDISNYTAASFVTDCQKALRADNESVLVYISSRGGNVDDGLRIYEQIRLMATIKPVDVLVSGYCYSACTWAIMSLPVENRWISANSRVMFHPAQSSGPNGKVVPRDELDEFNRKQLDDINNRWMIDEVARHTDIRRSDLQRLVDEDGQDVFMSAAYAVELGIFAGVV